MPLKSGCVSKTLLPLAAFLFHGAKQSSSKVATHNPPPNPALQLSPSKLLVLFFSTPYTKLGLLGLKTQKSCVRQAYCKGKVDLFGLVTQC